MSNRPDIVLNTKLAPAAGCSHYPYDPAKSYTAGDTVTFNGSLYRVLAAVTAGVIPPIEVATPAVPGIQRYSLMSRGRTSPEPFDATKPYFQDQVVTYNGGLYLLDAPSVPIGTAPTSAQWLPLSDGLGLTLEESMTLQLANVTPGTGVTAGHNPLNSYDLQRVKGHRFRYIVAGGVLASGEVLATVTFPLPFPGAKKPPRITLSPGNQGAVAAGLYAEPLTSGLMIVGYSIRVAYTVPVGARVDVATQVDAYLS